MPAFRSGKPKCRLQLLANQVLPAGANDIVWDTAVFDDTGGWASGSTWTADRPGLYLFGVAVNRAAVATAAGTIVRARKNGVTEQQVTGAVTTVATVTQVVTLLEVLEGDTLSANTTLHGSLSATMTAGNTVMWLTRVGPKNWT